MTPVQTYVVDEHILVISIDRPAARNAIDLATATALSAAFDRLDAFDELRAGVLTGSHGTFCAGMDLKAFLRGERPSLPGLGFAGLTERTLSTPLVAAIEGYALGGGFELALACDLIVASKDAQFGLVETTRGLVAAGGGLLRLPRRVPYHRAMELVLTGRLMDGAEAESLGLANRLCEPGETLPSAIQLARDIASNGPLAVRASKAVISQSRGWANGEEFDLQRQYTEPVVASNDAAEGALAFAEKRAPRWSGT